MGFIERVLSVTILERRVHKAMELNYGRRQRQQEASSPKSRILTWGWKGECSDKYGFGKPRIAGQDWDEVKKTLAELVMS